MSLDQLLFRKALGRFATGVCVITTNAQNGLPIGMTVNSFSAVSLDPPLVLWSIQKKSECFSFFEQSLYYGVNILSQQQRALADKHATKDKHELQVDSYRVGRTGCPVLKEVIASFECKVIQRYDGGDHTILLAQVLEASNKPTGKPLIFYAGQYRELK